MSDPRRGFLKTMLGSGVAAAVGLVTRQAHAQVASPAAMPGMDMPPTTPAAGMEGMAMGAEVPLPDGAPPADSPLYHRYRLDLRVVRHELVPGVVAHMMGYNGQVPAPTIRVNEGDWVWVDFINSSDEMHTIHWHGLIVPYRMDGVPSLTQDPVMRGGRYRYVFQAKPYGTHFYHCHFGTSMHMQAGMYGAFIVERPDDPIRARYPYTQDHVLVLSSIDTGFVREQMNSMFARMRQRDVLMARGRLGLRIQARFRSLAELVRAIADGYVPPYALARVAPAAPEPNFFTVNGKSYPATEPIRVREGEWTRLRFINAGNVVFNFHLHGHDFLHVCDDGNPLPMPVQMNTIVVAPGKTQDVVFLANNPGFWALHDHDVTHTTNNGVYPGGAMTHVDYEGFRGSYTPEISLDE
jgi:FtsP/CotA-like multicopper oxidase with cupredoxin domain